MKVLFMDELSFEIIRIDSKPTPATEAVLFKWIIHNSEGEACDWGHEYSYDEARKNLTKAVARIVQAATMTSDEREEYEHA